MHAYLSQQRVLRSFDVQLGQFSSEELLEADDGMIFMGEVDADGAGDGVDLALHAHHLQVFLGMDGTLLVDLLRLHCYYYYNWQIVEKHHCWELPFTINFVLSYSKRAGKGLTVLLGTNFLRMTNLFLAYCSLISPRHLRQSTSFSSLTPWSIINCTISLVSAGSRLKTSSKICMNLFLQSMKLLVPNLAEMVDQFMWSRLISLMIAEMYLRMS